MATFSHRTKDGGDPKDKPRVYFTCHPDDFDAYFRKIVEDIYTTHDCAIYYTEDMRAPIAQEELSTNLGRMNLIIVPVTYRLLTNPCRAMDVDIAYAKQVQVPILPLVMEENLNDLYSDPAKFGKRQYLDVVSKDVTAIPYTQKLRKHLDAVLISDELAQRIRAAFDAYIFLSYRKKDRWHANELMKLIHKNPECRDIAIWYDEFLTPGESFADNIQRALEDSKLFALLVTPNILEEPEGRPNYIMAEEYPAAKKAGKFILPVAMEQTDRSALLEKYQEIPDCIDPADESAFKEQLLAAILKTATTTHNDQPEHNFLIGLAYLEGIDVETDQERGISMITAVAEAELPEAMDYLYRIYANKKFADDDSSESNEEQALLWAKRRVTYYTKQYGQANPVTLRALIDLAESYFNVIEMSGESYEDYDDVFDYRSDAFLQEAIEHARTTYTLCLKVWGEEHTDSIDALHELGALLETVGDWIRSSEILQESYKLREKEYALCQKIYGSHWQNDCQDLPGQGRNEIRQGAGHHLYVHS